MPFPEYQPISSQLNQALCVDIAALQYETPECAREESTCCRGYPRRFDTSLPRTSEPQQELPAPPTKKVSSRGLGLHLHTMPLLDFFREYRVHKAMLLHDGQTLELLRDDIQGVHRATTTADILNLIFPLVTILPPSVVFLEPIILPIFQASRPP